MARNIPISDNSKLNKQAPFSPLHCCHSFVARNLNRVWIGPIHTRLRRARQGNDCLTTAKAKEASAG